MDKKVKYNFAIVKSIYGDIWVGKTLLPVEKGRIYADIKEAISEATDLLLEHNPCFDPDDEEAEDNDPETFESYNALQETTEDTAEEAVEKFIIRR